MYSKINWTLNEIENKLNFKRNRKWTLDLRSAKLKMDLNWIRKSFVQCLWFFHVYFHNFDINVCAIMYWFYLLFFHCIWSICSLFSFLLSHTFYLSIKYYDSRFLCCIIMLWTMIDNVFRSNLLTAYQMVENRTDLKCLMSLYSLFLFTPSCSLSVCRCII